jgi:hypothetical protein
MPAAMGMHSNRDWRPSEAAIAQGRATRAPSVNPLRLRPRPPAAAPQQQHQERSWAGRARPSPVEGPRAVATRVRWRCRTAPDQKQGPRQVRCQALPGLRPKTRGFPPSALYPTPGVGSQSQLLICPGAHHARATMLSTFFFCELPATCMVYPNASWAQPVRSSDIELTCHS